MKKIGKNTNTTATKGEKLQQGGRDPQQMATELSLYKSGEIFYLLSLKYKDNEESRTRNI